MSATKAQLKRFIRTSDISESHTLFRLAVNSSRLGDGPTTTTVPAVLFDYEQFLDFESRQVDNTPHYFPGDDIRKPVIGPFTDAVRAGTACIIIRLPGDARNSYHCLAYVVLGLDRHLQDDTGTDAPPVHLVRMQPLSERIRKSSCSFRAPPREPAIADAIIRTFQNATNGVRASKGLLARKFSVVESCLPVGHQVMTETSGLHAIFSVHSANRCREDLLPILDAFAVDEDEEKLWKQADRIFHQVTSWGKESKLPAIYVGPSTRFFQDISAAKSTNGTPYASSWDLILLEFVIHIVISWTLGDGAALKTRKQDVYAVILDAKQQALASFKEGVTCYRSLSCQERVY
ncbi:hypothetical protein QFC20_006019 [Naganishia adeliensis]|uniref:Uncharacterized protein n=1 Tax=Naganishia adeliensis TaxID=92952 RepID=A0ACC2VH43_9TREE|nr:hypothetical protein QFC20_006019 [Naganishia adeliensis]